MKKIFVLIGIFSLTGCAYLQTVENSPQFKAFCSWSPVAIEGIGAAIIQSSNDPAKAKVTQAMSQALVFLKLAAAQCPPVAP